jgi:hypothetical protein
LLPHQFAFEYVRGRHSTILKQVRNYLKIEDALRKIKDTDIAPRREHPYLSENAFRAFEAIQSELSESRKALDKLVQDDPYAGKLLQALEGRVSLAPSPEEVAKLHEVAKARYDKKIPPGFADLKEKDVPDAYGDYIGWSQLMQIAAKEQRGIIFVTDDFKNDWWHIEGDRTVGPRPELLEEFARTTQQQICLYTSELFLRAAKEFMAADIREDVIEEVTQRLASQRDTQRSMAEMKLAPTEADVPESDKMSGDAQDTVHDWKSTSSVGSDADKLRPETE